MSRRRAERSISIIGWVGQVIAWSIILAVGALLVVSVLIPRIVGATPYTILTSSMEPAMPPGTLVVVKPVDTDQIGVGEVVTYQLESGQSTVVTHRVAAVGLTAKGETVFTTQGDANDVADEKPVRPVQIRGERLYFVPYIGKVTTVVTSSQRGVATVVIVLGLFGYSASMLVGAARDRRRPPTSDRTINTDSEEVSA